eukprot:1940035-Alexandrium_andersonii.AAC.1
MQKINGIAGWAMACARSLPQGTVDTSPNSDVRPAVDHLESSCVPVARSRHCIIAAALQRD